jgi:hypothetical protein
MPETYATVEYQPGGHEYNAHDVHQHLEQKVANVAAGGGALLLHNAWVSYMDTVGDILEDQGYVRPTRPISFNHPTADLPPQLEPPYYTPTQWSAMGLTPLHADSQTSRSTLSIAYCYQGRFAIDVFQTQPMPPWSESDILRQQTMRIALQGKVDTRYINPLATRHELGVHDLLVFDAAQYHMGRTLIAPRASHSTIYHLV